MYMGTNNSCVCSMMKYPTLPIIQNGQLEIEFFKFMNNSIFDKKIQNIKKMRVNIRFANVNTYGDNYYMSIPIFNDYI